MSELLKINVNDHTERKNGLTYLSWAWAWAEVLKIDPGARWHATEYSDPRGCAMPAMFLPDGSAMVKVEVTIKGDTKCCLLPVMNHKNQAIKGPDAFAVNTAIVRCLTKCIAMFGLGLYIYAGEDLPEQEPGEEPEQKPVVKAIHKPTDGAGDGLSEEDKAELEEIALYLVDCHKNEKDLDAIRFWYADNFKSNDHKVYVWSLLAKESKLRSTIKANRPEPVAA